MTQPEFDSAITRIRARFLDRLAGQYNIANRNAQDAQRLEENVDNLREIQLIAHKIAGIAATVGFPELGQAAFEADQTLRQKLACEAANPAGEETFLVLREFLVSCENVLSKN